MRDAAWFAAQCARRKIIGDDLLLLCADSLALQAKSGDLIEQGRPLSERSHQFKLRSQELRKEPTGHGIA